MQLTNALEVGVILGKHNVCHVKLGYGDAVFLEAREKLASQAFGDEVKALVNLKKVDCLFLDYGRKICLNRIGNQRTEGCLKRLRAALGIVPGYAFHGSHELQKKLSGVADLDVHLTGCTDFKRCARKGINEAHLVGSTPLYRHLGGHIYEIDL